MNGERLPPDRPEAWLAHARSDLRIAEACIEGVFLEDLCYHAQQAAEKALKAVLLAKNGSFPYTHNLAELVYRLQCLGVQVPQTILDAVGLTSYAVERRYPGFDQELTEQDRRLATGMAASVLEWAHGEVARLTRSAAGPVLYVARIRALAECAPTIDGGLELAGLEMTAVEDVDAGTVIYESYHETPEAAAVEAELLNRCLHVWFPSNPPAAEVAELEKRDWAEYWKRFFHAERISDRLVIKPTWEDFDTQPGDVVLEIDPGMSFGTGRHPTSKACLRYMERIAGDLPGASFLDIGCGSGILLIGAAKLGYGRIVGFDNDPLAVTIAHENLHGNGVADRVVCREQDLAAPGALDVFDVVCANMFAHELKQFRDTIAAAVAPGGGSRLIVAGILAHQYEEVRRAYEEAGFRELDAAQEKEWISGLFARRTP